MKRTDRFGSIIVGFVCTGSVKVRRRFDVTADVRFIRQILSVEQ